MSQINRFKLKSYFALSKEAQIKIYDDILKHAAKYFDEDFSISLVIKKVYYETNYTQELCTKIIRSSNLCEEYRLKRNLKSRKHAATELN